MVIEQQFRMGDSYESIWFNKQREMTEGGYAHLVSKVFLMIFHKSCKRHGNGQEFWMSLPRYLHYPQPGSDLKSEVSLNLSGKLESTVWLERGDF